MDVIDVVLAKSIASSGSLPASTKYGASISLTIDSSTFVVTAVLKDQDGNNLGNAQTIDLPLESVVVNGSYDSLTKEVVLTLQNGNTVRFSVADLVSGLVVDHTNYIELANGIRLYISDTTPPGTIPEGSIGIGF